MLLNLLQNIYYKGRLILIGVLLLISINFTFAQNSVLVQRGVMLMGSTFNITLVDKDTVSANININNAIDEIARIENLISEWRPNTQISNVNKYAGIQPVKVDKEVFELTKRAIEYSKMSSGAFDISIASMDKIWKFDGSMDTLPNQQEINLSIKNIGYKHIVLDSLNSTIYLSKKGMKIGFGSIGKGYAADKARELLQNLGINSGIVDASGDIAVWGMQPNGKAWMIGIKNPFKKHKSAKILKLNYDAVATSGNYQKYAEINNVRYSHIINPKTGYPTTGLTSVTIYGPSTEFSNALSTSVMVLGKEDGLKLLKKHKKYQYLLITDEGKIIK